MYVRHDHLDLRTNGKGLYEITDEVQAKIDRCGVRNGTVTVFVQHTSCSIVIMENADPTARDDLEEFFDRLVPEDADYFTHGSEGSDDMPSHIRMVLTRTSETVPIANGKMQLGTWQGIFLFEHRRAAAPAKNSGYHYRRTVAASLCEVPRVARILASASGARLTEARLQIRRGAEPTGTSYESDQRVRRNDGHKWKLGMRQSDAAPPRKLPGDGAARDSLSLVQDSSSRLNPHCG